MRKWDGWDVLEGKFNELWKCWDGFEGKFNE